MNRRASITQLRMALAPVLVLCVMAACHNAQHPPRSSADLSSRIGQQVHLEGRFGGPGQIADYIIVDGTQIYLTGDVNLNNIEYGSTIAVDGVLGFYKAPDIRLETDRPVGRPPDHFYIDGAAVRLIRQSAPLPNPTPLTVAMLEQQPVIGYLGVPLGTAVEITAVIVSGDELNSKAYASAYLLNVSEVDGKPLAEPHLFMFFVPSFTRVKVANDSWSLHELRTGREAGELDHPAIAKLEEGYVGKQVHLLVYETGLFDGIPQNLPDHAAVWQGSAFAFSTSLTVLAER